MASLAMIEARRSRRSRAGRLAGRDIVEPLRKISPDISSGSDICAASMLTLRSWMRGGEPRALRHVQRRPGGAKGVVRGPIASQQFRAVKVGQWAPALTAGATPREQRRGDRENWGKSTPHSPSPQIAAAELSPHPHAPLYSRRRFPEGAPGLRPTSVLGGCDCGAWEIRAGWPNCRIGWPGGGVTTHNQGFNGATHLCWDAQVFHRFDPCRPRAGKSLPRRPPSQEVHGAADGSAPCPLAGGLAVIAAGGAEMERLSATA